MILSAVSLFKKYDLSNPLSASEWGEESVNGAVFSHVTYSGHAAEDGSVRIYARFAKPDGVGKKPAVLLLGDVGKCVDEELMSYFLEKGYAVLMPDYSGKSDKDDDNVMRTLYPTSLEYGNYEKAQGLHHMHGVDADQTSWFEWTYVALYSIEYLKSRDDIGNIGVVGIRVGGAIAWQTMLSPDLQCGVPVNSVGWRSFLSIHKFSKDSARNLSDDRHRYIAAVEAQSYAPYVKCPVLMLCSLHDSSFDYDRAYDTYSRIGNQDGNALVYSAKGGVCIDPNGLSDMDLFLEKNLKGRQVYIPEGVNVSVQESDGGGLTICAECDKEGILEEMGIYYAEADITTKSTYRDWHKLCSVDGRSVKNGRITVDVTPFEGAKAAFVYAYAKFINGFRITSKILGKVLSNPDENAVKSRVVYGSEETDTFGVDNYEEYSIGGIFLEREAVPKLSPGYADIKGSYSVGGIKTYKISSPRYVPDENALLKFDAYSATTQTLQVSIEVAARDMERERYVCNVDVKGGGKWKRFILKANEFKGEKGGLPLGSFNQGSALSFDCTQDENEFSITNILWL